MDSLLFLLRMQYKKQPGEEAVALRQIRGDIGLAPGMAVGGESERSESGYRFLNERRFQHFEGGV